MGGGGGSQQVGGVGEGNARPILADAVGVFLEPGGGVADGEGVVLSYRSLSESRHDDIRED